MYILLYFCTFDPTVLYVPSGVCREHGKAYAVYLITVTKIKGDGSKETWDVYRRYSDFDDLHSTIQDRVGNA